MIAKIFLLDCSLLQPTVGSRRKMQCYVQFNFDYQLQSILISVLGFVGTIEL